MTTIGFVSLGFVLEEQVITNIFTGGLSVEIDNPPYPTRASRFDFQFFKSNNFSQIFTILSGGVPLDITGMPIIFTIKRLELDADPLIQKKNIDAGGSPTEIEVIDPVNGKISVNILPEDTDEVDGNIIYWYDIQITINTAIKTVHKGRVYIIQPIT